MMDQFIAFGIVGLSTAAIYAIISSGWWSPMPPPVSSTSRTARPA